MITPYKHHFSKFNKDGNEVKIDGKHIYERDVEFSEYFNLFKNERLQYPIIIKNILGYELLHMTEKWCACSAPSVYL